MGFGMATYLQLKLWMAITRCTPWHLFFFDSETKENWTWFMEQLSKSIGPMENLAICTDACKGLEAAVAKVFPNSEQRECFRHLMENMRKYYSGDVYAKN